MSSCVCGAGDWTQGLAHKRYVLHHLEHALALNNWCSLGLKHSSLLSVLSLAFWEMVDVGVGPRRIPLGQVKVSPRSMVWPWYLSLSSLLGGMSLDTPASPSSPSFLKKKKNCFNLLWWWFGEGKWLGDNFQALVFSFHSGFQGLNSDSSVLGCKARYLLSHLKSLSSPLYRAALRVKWVCKQET